MLGRMILGQEALDQQEIKEVLGSEALGTMVVTAADQVRLLEGRAPRVQAVDEAETQWSYREVRSMLADNPVLVDEVLRRESARPAAALELRVSVLDCCRQAAARLEGREPLVAVLDQLLAEQRATGGG